MAKYRSRLPHFSEYRHTVLRHPRINVLGGCCGTDHRHIDRISQACRAAA
jgi:methionine synthase I (cobalamin-dependent)